MAEPGRNIQTTLKANSRMLLIDKYAYITLFKDVHPVEKGVFAFSLLLFCIVTKNLYVGLFTFSIMSTAIVMGAKIPLRYYTQMLKLPAFFLLTSALAMLVSFAPADVALSGYAVKSEVGRWQIYITVDNVKRVVGLVISVFASVSCMYFFILTTPAQQMAWLMHKLRIPALFIDLSLSTYRFIFILLQTVYEIRLSQASRLGYKSFRSTIISLGQLASVLFIKTMKSAEEVNIAMATRGNDESVYQTHMNLRFRSLHWAVITLAGAFQCLLLFIT
ncbi:cobalt ECF transporter T component CbiQ [Peribacillus saganii]|nr:cobalt ECF transporter T component CbiQ [Peribacillus saganii]